MKKIINNVFGAALTIWEYASLIYLAFWMGLRFLLEIGKSFATGQRERAANAFWHWFRTRKSGTDGLSKWIERRTNNWHETNYTESRLKGILPAVLFKKPFEGEIKEFDASEFAGYEAYNRANPDRFKVAYDENGNRIQ